MRRLLSGLVLALCAGCADRAAPAPGTEAAAPETRTASGPDRGSEPDRASASVVLAPAELSEGEAPAARVAPAAAPAERPVPPVRLPAPDERPVFHRPEHVRAVYLNAWSAGSTRRLEALIELARRTEINSFVIDIKDASGYVSHASGVALAREIGATGDLRIRDLPGLLDRLEAEGIWPIARIVIVKDKKLAEAHPEWTVQDSAGGPWMDPQGTVWLNPGNREVWRYHLDLAQEVARLGFPEVQWDYVRFPDASREALARARFPGKEGMPKEEVIRAFLGYAGERLDGLGLDVVHSADVFGVTTSAKDVGIGQVWERFIDRLDVALPMVYPSHYYPGSFGFESPNAHPYEIVRAALSRAVARSAEVPDAGRVRPWLQDFDLGEPAYGAPEVRAQIQAALDVGVEEWVLWNPGSRYTEAALEPVAGWAEEPTMRVASRVVPVSRRFEALERPAPADPVLDASPPPPAPARPRVLDPDSLRSWVDSIVLGRDGR